MKTYLLKTQDDIWHRFKVAAAVKGHSLKAALETAIAMYILNTTPEEGKNEIPLSDLQTSDDR